MRAVFYQSLKRRHIPPCLCFSIEMPRMFMFFHCFFFLKGLSLFPERQTRVLNWNWVALGRMEWDFSCTAQLFSLTSPWITKTRTGKQLPISLCNSWAFFLWWRSTFLYLKFYYEIILWKLTFGCLRISYFKFLRPELEGQGIQWESHGTLNFQHPNSQPKTFKSPASQRHQ